MIIKLIKVVTIGFFVTVYLILGIADAIRQIESAPWPGY